MNGIRSFLVSQGGKPIACVEASDKDAALTRAKGLGNVLDFSPSLPLEATEMESRNEDVPSFRNDYFELLGFTR
ncbi:hypothetical protein BJN45_02995 [Azonexus hydrophilus]|uniref:Uncharacterized protein n=1 Tax=Azonexus hydrophilus TaxID=418702 RepID=A0A1R1ID26_9RHOO|nr:hypothetical protein BJN45_02995 [Azonexus hydrophilus]